MKKYKVYNVSGVYQGMLEEVKVNYPRGCTMLQLLNDTFCCGLYQAIEHAYALGYGIEIEDGVVVYGVDEYKKYDAMVIK